jgi:CTP:molybdopterin cytidylyltransferase MocA
LKKHFERKSFSAIIPAAGNSGRMGSDKALLVYREGQSFASHLVNSYSSFGAQPVVLIVNDQNDQPDLMTNALIRVINRHTEYGRSHSIFLGLQQVPDGNACFIQNIDNPFIDPDLLAQMIALIESDQYIVPVWNAMGGHPVLLGQDVVRHIQGMNALPDFREILKEFNRVALPYPDDRILLNINTPSEYARFLKMD